MANNHGRPGFYRLDSDGEMYWYESQPWIDSGLMCWLCLGDCDLVATVKTEQWPEDDFWKTWEHKI